LTGKEKTPTFAVPKRTGLGKRKQRDAATELKREREKEGKKNFEIVLARMKKDSHLCSPETDRFKTKSARLEEY
jgi:hypothetical protein